MPMSDQLAAAFNRQIAAEFSAAYKYLAMAAYFDGLDLSGMAHWMEVQHEEEIVHARKFFDFVLERDEEVVLDAIPAPPQSFSSPEEAFAAALGSEQSVTGMIHDLYRLAQEEGDYASVPLLQWFVEEQNEEEASVSRILQRVRMAADNPAAMLVLDRELGERMPE
jgi:ferritin